MRNVKLMLAIIFLAAFLRLWALDKVPVSLMGDELDLGYQAYSILKTGKDYSGNPWPLHFQSLAEWRTPLYLYSSIPTVMLFGITPWGVRLPAAMFGILGVWLFYLVVKTATGNRRLALLASFLLAISPWHIQYSRAGFEVTQMLALYLAGIYFFILALKRGKLLAISAIFLALTPWAYSTAKFFAPLTIVALCAIWWKDLIKLEKKYLLWAFTALLIVGVPIAYSTVFGGGTARFGNLSVFTDPTTVPEIGFARLHDAKMRDNSAVIGIQPTIVDRLFHNKITQWTTILGRNYLQSFSTQFLFIEGDLNPRHSPDAVGQFYKIEALFLILGIIFFFTRPFDRKIKLFLIFWLLSAPLPAALTRDGGMHATRLFFFLPPLMFMIALGIFQTYKILSSKWRKIFLVLSVSWYLVSFIFYQHNYWVHYPWNSERWWHAGFEDAIKTTMGESSKFDKVIFSMADEPSFIFFLGWSAYPPAEFQSAYIPGEFLQQEEVPHFGKISKVGKFYFGSPSPRVGVYDLASVLPPNTLYMASSKEVSVNLILEPDRKPGDLNLIKAVAFPSGEPAFYLFSKR